MILRFLTPLLALILFFSACSSSSSTANKERIRIGVLPAEISFPFFVGRDEKIFTKYGWDLEIIPFQSSNELCQSFQSKEVDCILADIVTTTLLQTSGQDVSAVALIRGSSPNEGRIAILAAPGSGIHRLKDLEGQGIALSKNTHTEFVFDTLMKYDHASPEKANKIKIPKIPLRYTLLMSGQIPAAVLPEPIATLAETNGAFLLKDDSEDNFSQIVLTVQNRFLEQEKEQFKTFIEAYNETTEVINAFPAKFRTTYLKACNIPTELEESYPIRNFSPAKNIPRSKWHKVYAWLEHKDLIEKQINFENATTSSYLPSASIRGEPSLF